MQIFRPIAKYCIPILLLGNYLIIIYRIVAIWRPPLPRQLSPLFHYMGIPLTDILFPPSLAVNLVHQHGSLLNWLLSPAPYLFPDLLLSIVLAFFTKNVFVILLVYGLIQIIAFTLFAYWLVRLITRSDQAGYCVLFSILLALCIVAYPDYFPTFGTINVILAPMMHFSMTIMIMVLLMMIIYVIRHGISLTWTLCFSLLFFAITISDPGMLIHFSLPIFFTLLINRSIEGVKNNFIQLLILTICLSILSWYLYNTIPIHIDRINRPFGFRYDYTIRLFSLLSHFFRHAPIIASLWLLSFICALCSLLYSRWTKNSDHLILDFVICLFCLQIVVLMIAMNFFPMIPLLPQHLYPMRYLQPAIILPIFVGLPLLIYKHGYHYYCQLTHKVKFTLVIALLLATIAVINLIAMPQQQFNKALHPYPQLIACLDRHARQLQLHYGISSYLDSYLINDVNRSNIKVVSGVSEKDVVMQNYLNNIIDSGVSKFDFIVTSTPPSNLMSQGRALWLSPDTVERIVGTPSLRFSCPPYRVLVYKKGQINHHYITHQ